MYDTEHTITVSTIRYRTQTREHIWCMTQNTQYRSPCPLHTQAHTTIGNLGVFHWLEGTLPFGHNARLNTHGKWHLSQPSLVFQRRALLEIANIYVWASCLSCLRDAWIQASYGQGRYESSTDNAIRQTMCKSNSQPYYHTVSEYLPILGNLRVVILDHFSCANCRIRRSEFACHIFLL